MPLQYKIDVLTALKERGYTTYKLRKEKILGERVIQQLREGAPVSWEVLSRLCVLLDCDVGDILTANQSVGHTPEGYMPSGSAAN